MKRIYLTAGAAYSDTAEKQAAINTAIASMEWQSLPGSFGFMHGFALKEMIKSMGYNTDKAGIAPFVDGQTMLAIRNNYTKGDIRRVTGYGIYTGDLLLMVAVDEETAENVVNAG